MNDLDQHGRPRPALAADEVTTLVGFLEFQRATFAWKCQGLDAAGLRTRVAASSMTLGGMLKHLARAEDSWFAWFLRGLDPEPPWKDVDWEGDWHNAEQDEPEQLRRLWRDTVERSRGLLAEALAEDGLGQLARRSDEGGTPSLRWILCHLIEEYARHNGHADLIREAIDGQTGYGSRPYGPAHDPQQGRTRTRPTPLAISGADMNSPAQAGPDTVNPMSHLEPADVVSQNKEYWELLAPTGSESPSGSSKTAAAR